MTMADLHPDVVAHIRRAEELPPVSDSPPGEPFERFYAEHRSRLAELLATLKADAPRVVSFELKSGLMPPARTIVDASIQELCGLPYRTPHGDIPACPGLTDGLFGCPPHAPPVDETRSLLRKATGLLVLQFGGREGSAPQGEIHHFLLQVSKALVAAGYDVMETYASGPCKVCPKGCGTTEECRFPNRRLFAFEACGIWVNSLVEAARPYPVLNGGPEPVEWLVDWRLPTQNTDSIRYNGGVLLG
jgi:hypothetical protein